MSEFTANQDLKASIVPSHTAAALKAAEQKKAKSEYFALSFAERLALEHNS